MAASYHLLTSIRMTEYDPIGLMTTLREIEPTIGMQHNPGTTVYRLKKNTPWTQSEITEAQTVIDTAPVRDEAALDVDQKVLKALAMGLWECIPNPTMTKIQLRTRILAIWRSL